MTNLNIEDLKFSSLEVGKMIKSTKLRLIWEFVLDGQKRKIELAHSKLSSKRRLLMDGKEILKPQKFNGEFSYSFAVDKHYVNINQVSNDTYDVKIDSVSFSTLLEQQKTNQQKQNVTPKKDLLENPQKTESKFSSNSKGKENENTSNIPKEQNIFEKADKNLEISNDHLVNVNTEKKKGDNWEFEFDDKFFRPSNPRAKAISDNTLNLLQFDDFTRERRPTNEVLTTIDFFATPTKTFIKEEKKEQVK